MATPGISEANHIHSGNCVDLGGVVYPLTNMAGGLSLTMVNASLSLLRMGDFAINLHNANDSSIYTSCDSIPVGADR